MPLKFNEYFKIKEMIYNEETHAAYGYDDRLRAAAGGGRMQN
jgi:hypothetical protein